jgi:hypothetical protein
VTASSMMTAEISPGAAPGPSISSTLTRTVYWRSWRP